MHDRFFADQTKLTATDIGGHASAIGADVPVFKTCVESGKYTAKVEEDIVAGHDLQVAGTPSFFVGYSDPTDPSRIRVFRAIVGDVPYGQFQKTIADALEAYGKTKEGKWSPHPPQCQQASVPGRAGMFRPPW